VKKLFIHVGAGKTGTSALQRFLLANEAALSKRGFHMPAHGRVQRDQGIQHHPLSDHGPYATGEALDAWKRIATEASGNAVVSSEYLHNKISGPSGPIFFAKIRNMFTRHGWQIGVVFYIRRQSQWLHSAYAQHVKTGLETRSWDEFAASYTRNLPDQIEAFAQVFGNDAMIVRPFERAQFTGGDIYRDFCAAIGLDWSDGFKAPKGDVNPRLCPEGLEIKRKLNPYFRTPQTAQPVLDALLAYSKDQPAAAPFFDPEIEAENAPKYERIARMMGRADGVLFHDGLGAETQKAPA
jgi:hypothetical protein